jgi:hypothetical protein
MVCARSLFLFAVIETAPPEEGVWYGGPEQPKVNGVVGEGACVSCQPFLGVRVRFHTGGVGPTT